MVKQILFCHSIIWFNLCPVITLPPVPEGSEIFSGFISFMTQTAAITSLTPAGGFFIDFTIVISAGYIKRKEDILIK